jgi:C4-dicarboxylate-specific signal transduction histidine kinase
MDKIANFMSLVLLLSSGGVFIYSIRLRHKILSQMNAKNEAIVTKETELKELRMLSASVTHEINNSISIILGRLEQLIKKNQDPLILDVLTNMRTTSERIVESVKGLRHFIYPDNSEVEELIHLNELIDDVLKLVGQRLKNHGITLRQNGLDHKMIKGKKSQLEQLIINLLNQSVERLDGLEEKWIQLVAVEENDKINLYFSDFSSQVGDKIACKQFGEILEKNHGHLTINQNNLVLELPRPDMSRYHF